MQENARTVPPGHDKETQEKTSKDKADELLEFEILTYPPDGDDGQLRYPLIWFLPGVAARLFPDSDDHDLTGIPDCPEWSQPGVKGTAVGWYYYNLILVASLCISLYFTYELKVYTVS